MNKLLSTSIFRAYFENASKNWTFSPASYLRAMSNLVYCVDGENLDYLAKALSIDKSEIPQQLITIKQQLACFDEIYDKLFYCKEYEPALNQNVVKQLTEQGVDLESFSSTEEAISKVNKTIAEKTRGCLPYLLSRDDVDVLTKFIILNCVYFKKEWVYEFCDGWSPVHFRNIDGTIVEYLPLFKRAPFRYYENDQYDLVELPYKKSSVCCYLFVPKNEVSITSLLEGFENHFARLREVSSQLEVDLSVPAFKIESGYNLNIAAKMAGLDCLFDFKKDWRLFNWDFLDESALIRIDKIIQKATFDFNKYGTEVSAATAIICAITGGCFFDSPRIKTIKIERPFIFCLADSISPDIPLFVGQVNLICNRIHRK